MSGHTRGPRVADVVSDYHSSSTAPTEDKNELDITVFDGQTLSTPWGCETTSCSKSSNQTVLFGGGDSLGVWRQATAFMGRSRQGLVDSMEARIQVYVDDPCTFWLGTSGGRQWRM